MKILVQRINKMLFLIGLVVGIALGIIFDDKIKPKILAIYNAVKTALKG